MAATTAPQPANPFIKHLASSSRKTRDRALLSLRTYLARNTPFTPLDLLKLWKGLYYSMWMSDKPLNQQRLVRDLADLVDVLRTEENVLGFLEAFWKTMAREWGGIDALRMDKYLYLVRCYVGKGFERCGREGWEGPFTERYLEVVEGTPLEPSDSKIPNGLRYHVIDVYVDELDKADGERSAPLGRMLGPLRRVQKEGFVKTVRKRAEEALEDERIGDWKGEKAAQADEEGGEEEEEDGEGGEFGGFAD
ncbi:ribosomal RNA-processing protein 1 homolog-like protein [Teratosphaeria destructans]|uniref:Ribosomal RNA-processing protein 1 homolog-like protein n=1 Tax=Teratosphaeria destructans TaxID=418781 RepID=A0A9W7T1U7_9PEZI|nr:ribosomal RNA-processing protein 1 homolog-like protein [Teratosphaeria destructans]